MCATKFKLYDKVSSIRNGTLHRTFHEACPVCTEAGATPGKVLLRGEMFDCPNCKGRGRVDATAYGWYVEHSSSVVVRVSIQVWMPDDTHDPGREVRYMIRASSDGRSGSMMREHELVAGDRDAAQAECDRRNAGGDYDE